MRNLVRYFILFNVLTGSQAYAKTKQLKPTAETLKVIYSASKKYDVDAQDLIKIAWTESKFKKDAVRTNKNGTIDFGMFQINSVHWTTTCKDLDIFKLKGNAECAARLVKDAKKHSDSDSNWLGRYHSKTPSLKASYAQKLNETPTHLIAEVSP